MTLSTIVASVGLLLDLIGVLLLGFDVLHVQKSVRKSANDVLNKVHSVFEDSESAGSSVREVAFDHRHYDWDEGQVVYFEGTFDERTARRAAEALTETVSSMAKGMTQLADIVIEGAVAQEELANLSRKRTFIGLTLIVVGFALQIIAQLT